VVYTHNDLKASAVSHNVIETGKKRVWRLCKLYTTARS